MIRVLLLSLFLVCLGAEEAAFEKFELNDGRTFVGSWDEKTGTFTIVNEKTGRPMGQTVIQQDAIKARSPVAIAVKTAAPAGKRGANGTWITNYQAALALAVETKRPILTVFTGSDWCPYCIKLEAEIFAKPEFKEWAKNNVVLLYLDYPRKTKLSKEIEKQNDELKKKFGIQGYPTVYLLKENGDRYDWKFGYNDAGVVAWVDYVEASRKNLRK